MLAPDGRGGTSGGTNLRGLGGYWHGFVIGAEMTF